MYNKTPKTLPKASLESGKKITFKKASGEVKKKIRSIKSKEGAREALLYYRNRYAKDKSPSNKTQLKEMLDLYKKKYQ